jgi:carboxylate-amine ligase
MTTAKTNFRPYAPRQAAERRLGELEPACADAFGPQTEAEQFTIGLEEELFLVDADTLDCVESMPEAFIEEAKAALGERVRREIIVSMLEIVTRAHSSLSAAGDELRGVRLELAAIASRHGLALLACGTHPFSDWRRQTLTPRPRYAEVATALGAVSKRIHVCGLHVHVALPDPARRISVMNRAQAFLPLLLALSTSSPFWLGSATGLKSYRSAAYDESPRTGLPIRFADMAEFERFVEKMRGAGFIPDQSFLWWAIRPSLRYPTLELRIADSCTDWRDSIAIAALYRCLVHALVRDASLGASWEEHHWLVNNENRWQAIRYGLAGTVLDPTAGSTRPMPDRVRDMLDLLQPSAIALGCVEELDGVAEILRRGTSADRQSRSYQLALESGASPDMAVRRVASDIARWTIAA